MSLHDLHAVFVSTQNACVSINAYGDLSLSQEFKELYAGKIKSDQSFSRHNEAVWLANDILELHSRGNRTVTYIPSVFFFVAQKLVPLYLELQAYRATLVRVLQQYNHTLDDTEEPNCVQYINAVTFLSDEEKQWLCKFVTDGSWWGKGRQIKRAQDFYESPLMQSASLTQETQSEVARITKQFAENPMLDSKLTVTKNGFAEESSNADRLTVALCYFKAHRNEFAEGLKINDGVRAYFSPLTPQKLRTYSQEEFEDLFLGKEKYEHMWAGTNGKGWGHIQKAGRGASMNFIASICDKAIPAEQFCDKKFAAPSGFGPVVVAELNLKFHPTEYCAYSKRTAQALEILGLKKNTYTSGFTAAEYNEVLKQTEVIRCKMESMGIGLTREDDSRPDYLSANEFIDFVCNYEDELKKKFSEAEPELPKNIDRLTLALKLFAERRYSEEWQANVVKDSYLHIFKVCETAVDDLRKMSLDEFKEKFLDRVWAFQNGGSRKYGQLSEEERVGYRDFVASLIPPIKSFGDYFPPSEKCPRGMGVGMISELLMRFHPDACCSYNDQLIHDALVTLGLAEGEFEWPKTPSIYQDFMGKCAKILRRMEEMKFARTPVEGDKDKPNYITVNEFLWFVHDHKDLIKEEIMAKEFKKVEKKPKKDGAKKLSDMMKDELLKRLAAALRTKPFAILAGHSGTGKSQMVRRLAYMTCADEGLMAEAKEKNAPGNFCMIQVRPNWHDSTDLLGYYSELGKKYRTTEFVEFVAKAHAYPEIPFFVCLDEMNLAPVEQYFAEYLSAIESADVKGGEFLTDALVSKEFPADEVMFHDEVRFSESKAWFEKHGLTIPKNLFVVGTVNMDDTTCQFSRKVLDRAMTIMMDKVSFRDMQDAAKSAAPSEADLLQYDDIKAFLGGELRAKPLDDDQVKMLEALEGVLGKTPFAVAYRYANEYALYEDSLLALEGKKHEDADADHAKTAMDHCVLMKVLPRVHGERKEMELIFRGKSDGTEKGLEGLLDKDTTLSGKKMEEILARKATYLSFWP